MAYRAPYVVPALKKHTATVIMAHGLGDRLVLSPANFALPRSSLVTTTTYRLTFTQYLVAQAGNRADSSLYAKKTNLTD